MPLDKALIVAALGGLAYVYLQEEERTREIDPNDPTCGPLARLKRDEEGRKFCEPRLRCRENYVISPDLTQCFHKDNPCGPGFRMDENQQCQITDEACGNPCYRLNAAQDDCVKIPNCGSRTGSDIGDVFLGLGESIAYGMIYDFLGRRIMSVADRRLAQEAARRAGVEAARRAATQATSQAATRGAAVGATRLATQVATRQLATRATQIATQRSAIAVATRAAKILMRRIAVQLARIAALSSTGIGILATPLMILSTSLSIGMTAGGVFFEVPPGFNGVWQWDSIPEPARIALTSLPVIGDILDMVMPYIFFTNSCSPGLESQNGLCYPPPEPDFNCEAFLCPVKPDRLVGYNAGNYLGATLFHLTKRIITDTGTIPNTCPPGRTHGQGGIFCYDKQAEPGNIILGTWWEHCRPGERDDLAFCAREHIDPCPAGSNDVGGTCWGTVRIDYLDDCSLGWDGCKHRTHRHCTSWGALGTTCVGGDCIGGCRSRPHHVQGITRHLHERNFRFESRPKSSRVLAPHPNVCVAPRSHYIAGLCYPNDQEMPAGYHRRVIGTLDPGCPGDKDLWRGYQMFNPTQDIGVSCQLATYTRPPFPQIGIFPMRRVVIEDPPPPPLPPYCGDLPKLPETDPQYRQRLCRETAAPYGFTLSVDGLSFHRNCRTGFSFNFENTNCEMIVPDGERAGELDSYPNAEGLVRVEYDFK